MNLLCKIRAALIKALGGYTSPPVPPQQRKPEKIKCVEEYEPRKMVVRCGTLLFGHGGQNLDTFIKSQIVNEFAKALYDNDCIKITKTETGFYGELWILQKAKESGVMENE